jgi:hypothetical protein
MVNFFLKKSTKNIYVTCLVEKLLLIDPIQREWSKNNNTDLQLIVRNPNPLSLQLYWKTFVMDELNRFISIGNITN